MAAGDAMEISITAQRENGSVILQVSTRVAAWVQESRGDVWTRLGLSNIRDRLAHLYGDGQQFSIANRTGGGAQVTLRVPLHTRPA